MLRKVAEAGIRISLVGLMVAAAPFMASLYIRYPVNRIVDDTIPRWWEQAMECRLPKEGPRDKVILFGAQRGDSLALVDLAGGRPTYTAMVSVDPPGVPVAAPTRRTFERDDPLYVILLSKEAMVWRFVGDVSRISRVVVSSTTRNAKAGIKLGAAGVIGVPPEKVSFVVHSDCLGAFSDARSPEGNRSLQATIRVMDETVPDMYGGVPSLGTIQFPSARIGSVASIVTGGVRMQGPPVDTGASAEYVVAAYPVENQPVRPAMTGIGDLVQSGHLQDLGDGHYRMLKPIPAIPVGLTGEDAVTFHLADGVDAPKGDPGDNCVVSDDGGRVLAGRDCNGRKARR